MKEYSKTKPRLILYVTPAEMKACKAMAAKTGLRTPHRWALSVVIRALAISP